MGTIIKQLQKAEIKRRSVCIPKDKQYLLPGIGEKLALGISVKELFDYMTP